MAAPLVTISDAAFGRIQALLAKRGKPSAGIKVGIRTRGCSGLSYTIEYADEVTLIRALQGRRDQVFVMTKVCTHGRSGRLALQMLEESLRRLQTDHLDLWQIHEVVYENDPDLHFARGGAIEALDEAKKQGKVRFVGFTGHKHPAIHLRMLDHKRAKEPQD